VIIIIFSWPFFLIFLTGAKLGVIKNNFKRGILFSSFCGKLNLSPRLSFCEEIRGCGCNREVGFRREREGERVVGIERVVVRRQE